MIWLVDDVEASPGLFLAGGFALLLLGVTGVRGFYSEVERNIRPPIALEDGYAHLGEWVTVTGIRFDCAQTFNFMSSDRKSVTSYVVASSEDGSVAAIARLRGKLDCGILPKGPILGRLQILHGNTHLASMRQSGIQIPVTPGPTLAFEMDLAPDSEWFSLFMGVACLFAGTRALRSGLRRRREQRRAATAA